MPRIPTLKGPTVASTPLPNKGTPDPGAAIQRSGQAIAGGLQAASSALAQEVQRRQAKVNRTVSNDALSELSAVGTGLRYGFSETGLSDEGPTPPLHGPQLPERTVPPLTDRNGLNAVDNQDLLDAYDKALERIEGQLTNDVQRQAFADRASRMRTQFQLDVARHADTEIDAAAELSYKTRKRRLTEEAMESRADILELDDAIAEGIKHIEARAVEEGWAPDTLEDERAVWVSEAVAGAIVGNLDDKRIEAARMIYDSELGELLEEGARGRVLELLEADERDADVTGRVNSILVKAGIFRQDGTLAIPPGGEITEAQQRSVIEQIAGIEDRELRGLVDSEVMARVGDIDALGSRQGRAEFDRWYNAIDNGDATYNDVPRADRAAMTPTQRNALRQLHASNLRGEGAPKVSNGDTLKEISTMPLDEFLEADLREFSDRLSTRDLNALLSLQDEKKKIRAGEVNAGQLTRVEELVKLGLDEAGVEDEALRATKVADAFDLVNTRRKERARDLTFDEIQEISNEVLLQTYLFRDRMWPIPNSEELVFASEVGDDELDLVFHPMGEIPPIHIKATQEYLKSRGQDPTDDKVEQIYGLWRMDKSKRPGLTQQIQFLEDEQIDLANDRRTESTVESQQFATQLSSEFDATAAELREAYDAVVSTGRQPNEFNMREAHLTNQMLKAGAADWRDIVPESLHERALVRHDSFGAVTGTRKAPRREVIMYWALVREGLTDEEARDRVGLPPRGESLLINPVDYDKLNADVLAAEGSE